MKNIVVQAIDQAVKTVQQKGNAAQTVDQTTQLIQQNNQVEAQYQQLATSVQQLRNQLRQKKELRKQCEECYEQLTEVKNQLNTMVENAFVALQSQLLIDHRVRVLNRSYDIVKAKLDGPKLKGAIDEIDIEKRKITTRITDLDADIEWLEREISRREGELWRLDQMRG